MWAQLITTRVKPGREAEVSKLLQQLRDIEQPGSGLIRTTAMRDTADPNRLLLLVVFESEEKARSREGDPRREAGLQAVRATMAELLEGDRTFDDLVVVEEFSP